MEIHYFLGVVKEIELAATTHEFAQMAASLLRLADAGTGEVTFAAANGAPPKAPGQELSEFRVRLGSGPLALTVERGSDLWACGEPEAIALLARNMPAEPSLPPGYHVHFEQPGRERFVSQESIPLIMMVANDLDHSVPKQQHRGYFTNQEVHDADADAQADPRY